MTEKLKQQLNEQLTLLPKESREAINSFDWVKISEEIGEKYFLDEDDKNLFQVDIGLVLVGLSEQEYLAQDVEDDIAVSKNHAEKMAEEVVEKILKPIYENLAKNIRKNARNMQVNWQQNLDFIISGGDYTAFIRRVEAPASSASGATSADRPAGNATFNPSKLDDLKSKFTI
jgi:hypothetical protein